MSETEYEKLGLPIRLITRMSYVDDDENCIRDADDELMNFASTAINAYHAQKEEITRLRGAIEQTLKENMHLADGDDCTLFRLKEALENKGG